MTRPSPRLRAFRRDKSHGFDIAMDGSKLLFFVILSAGSALSLLGCGGAGSSHGSDAQARRQLSLLSEIYGDYLNLHNDVPPKDEAAFRALFPSYERRLKAYNADTADELLTSPRDGEPFVVIYGKRLAPKDSPNTPWAAHEKTGVDGKRLAIQVRGQLVELSPEEFALQFPSK